MDSGSMSGNGRKKVSVVVANWNGKRFLEGCVESLLGTAYPDLEVLVVDDGSDDGSADEVERKYSEDPRFAVVRNQERLGLAPTFNRGYGSTDGEYVVFAHNDTYFHERDWLATIVEVLETNPAVGAAQPKMLCLDRPGVKLGVGWDVDKLGYPVYTEFYGRDDHSENSVTQTFIAWDACFVARRSTLDKVGQFEDSFSTFEEDYDLSWRLHLAGYKVVCVRGSRILHQSAQTSASLREESIFNSTKNHNMVLIRNMGSLMLVTRFPISLSGALLLATFDLAVRPRLGRMRVKGLKWLAANLRSVLAQRKHIQRDVRKVGDSAFEGLMKPVTFDRYLGVVKLILD